MRESRCILKLNLHILVPEAARLKTLIQRGRVHFPRKNIPILPAHLGNDTTNPLPLLLVSDTIRPPAIHAAAKPRVVQRVRFALLIEHMQQEPCIQPLKPKLGKTLEDARDAEVVV